MASNTAQSSRSQSSQRGTSTRRNRAAAQDALTLLRADHNAVLELFDKFESSRRKDQKQRIADQICMELTIHSTIEEEIFYPEIRQASNDEEADDALNEPTWNMMARRS